MSKDLLNPEKAFIFRILHRDNVGRVLKQGCECKSASAGKTYTEIGNHDLIQKRETRVVPVEPGGMLSDYVPFYFTPYSPMMLNIKTGWNGIPKRSMSEIVILVSSLHHLADRGIPFVYSDRHAYLRTAQFSNDLKDLDRIIWPSLQARDFKRDDTDKVDRYQAEALVHKHVSLDALLGIACYDDTAKAAVEAEAGKAGAAIKIAARKGWFL